MITTLTMTANGVGIKVEGTNAQEAAAEFKRLTEKYKGVEGYAPGCGEEEEDGERWDNREHE